MAAPDITPLTSTSIHHLGCKPRLFLWMMRHTILAVKWGRPLCAHVCQTADIANVPMMPFLVEELLYSVAQHAERPMAFGHPDSAPLLEDELRFIECLRVLLGEQDRTAPSHLFGIVDHTNVKFILPSFSLLAATLNQLSSAHERLWQVPVIQDNEPTEIFQTMH